MRIESLRGLFKANGIDSMLVTNAFNIYYLSGFTGSYAFMLVTKTSAFLFTDFRYVEQAENETSDEIKIVKCASKYNNDELSKLIKAENLCSVGFECEDVSYEQYVNLNRRLDFIKLVSTKGLVFRLRSIKDLNEISNIEKACNLGDQAFDYICSIIRPGIAEKHISMEFDRFFLDICTKVSFTSIVASGARGSLPHGVASDKVIRKGDMVTLDFGCYFNRYSSDMTRTVVLGKASNEQREIYNLVLKAQTEAINAVCENVLCREIDGIARNIIKENGYGSNFGHGLGHGVCLEVHEMPTLSPSSEDNLKIGMVFSVEPGIYLPGCMGVRIEDLVAITPQGPKILTKSSRELIQL